MTVWVEDLGRSWCGHEFAISTEKHDGLIYVATSVEDAVSKYEADRRCKVDKIERR